MLIAAAAPAPSMMKSRRPAIDSRTRGFDSCIVALLTTKRSRAVTCESILSTLHYHQLPNFYRVAPWSRMVSQGMPSINLGAETGFARHGLRFFECGVPQVWFETGRLD
jgi:hypothetical protein